jgi:hypothetical protein
MLAKEMPNARLLEAESLVELRLKPERLSGEIAGFLDERWRGRRSSRSSKAARPRRTKAAPAKRRSAARG